MDTRMDTKMKSEIIYEDHGIIVIYKPAGLPVQTAQLGTVDCVSELKNYLHYQKAKAGDSYLGLIHRLDQPVEGLLVFAKTRAAAANLSTQMAGGMMQKKYYAMVCAGPGQQQNTWQQLEDYLVKDSGSSMARVTKKQPQAKHAVLRYRFVTEETAVGTKNVQNELHIKQVEIELETGRFHQIRVQMAHHGMPLLGDLKYGTQESNMISRQRGICNVALCAYRLECKNPLTGKGEVWECKPRNPAFQAR